MLIDYHMHTLFSADSIVPPRDAVERAIELGFDEITFTDHMDLLPEWIHDDTHILNAEAYFPAMESLQWEYRSQIRINIGVEVGLNRGMAEKCRTFVQSYPFDFVIASLHRLEYHSVRNEAYLLGFGNKESLYRFYYRNFYDMLEQFDDFSVCGHLDFIRRIMPFEYTPDDKLIAREIVTDILNLLISRGQGIEINTSGLRHPSAQPLPHLEIVKLYHDLGGRILTVGADSHRINHVGYGIRDILASLPQWGIHEITTFRNRIPTQIAID